MNKVANQIIAEQDAEIARLKNLLNQVEGYMGHAPICCFKPPDGDRCDCGLWEVKRQINEAIGEQKGGE